MEMETLTCPYRPWPDLPDPLLEIILERLPLSGYVRFSAVCRRWSSVQSSHRRRHSPSPPPMLRLPWIISSRLNQETLSCYSPCEGRFFTVSVPSSYYHNSFAHGWLFILNSGNLILWNPISCSQIELPLPPQTSYRWPSGIFHVSPPPYYIVFCMDHRGFVLLRWSDSSWVEQDTLRLLALDPLDKVVYCGGKYYCITRDISNARWVYSHQLIVVDALAAPATIQSYSMKGRSRMTKRKGCMMPKRSECRHGATIFVEFDEEPLLVKEIVRHHSREMTVGFEVLRADLGRNMWVRVDSIGDDRVIMLHKEHRGEWSVSLLAADVGAKGNCIYFHTRLSWKVFDLGTGMVTDLLLPNASQFDKICHQVFVPSLC